MNDNKFLIKYEELLDKGYCNCNEMNCIDNDSPRRILNIAKKLQQQNQKYKEVIDKLRKSIDNCWYMDNENVGQQVFLKKCELKDILKEVK